MDESEAERFDANFHAFVGRVLLATQDSIDGVNVQNQVGSTEEIIQSVEKAFDDYTDLNQTFAYAENDD